VNRTVKEFLNLVNIDHPNSKTSPAGEQLLGDDQPRTNQRCIDVGAQSTLGGYTLLPENICMKN